MPRQIHSGYYEDNYIKSECADCKRSFIAGETLSKNQTLSCPYCRSRNLECAAAAMEDSTGEMGLGCLGIHFQRNDSGDLLLCTERELAEAVGSGLYGGCKTITEILEAYCTARDAAEKASAG